jgi:glycosyltransferase involved in cell wall biosynthesis
MELINSRQLSSRKVVVVTPVKNESWYLDTFLTAASTWADHIIVSDQNSTDESRAIMKAYPKVTIISNDSAVYNENENRKSLLMAARRFGDENLIFSLDADEIVDSSILYGSRLKDILAAPRGTGFTFTLANIRSNKEDYWPVSMSPTAFIDDGRMPDAGGAIHLPRTCFSEFSQTRYTGLHIMHMQYLDERRVLTKQVWYQMWERLNSSRTSAIKLYRRYHHRDSIRPTKYVAIPQDWVQGYRSRNIDVFRFERHDTFWWDSEIEGWFQRFGLAYFKWLDLDEYMPNLADHRRADDKLAFRYLRLSQPHYRPLERTLATYLIFIIDRIWEQFWKMRP